MKVKLIVYRSWSQITVITKEVDYETSEGLVELAKFVKDTWSDAKKFRFDVGSKRFVGEW